METKRASDANLRLTENQTKFHTAIYKEIAAFLKDTILEVGSGRGTYSDIIISNHPENSIILSDIDSEYVGGLGEKYSANKNIKCMKLDLEKEEDFRKLGKVDSIIMLNVLEHVKDDIKALRLLRSALNPGGSLVCLVPCHKFLYNALDEDMHHYRRYEKKELIEKASKAGFHISKMWYFNMFSILGWYINGNILKKGIVEKNAYGIFNTLVPLLMFMEKHIFFRPTGLSLICIMEK